MTDFAAVWELGGEIEPLASVVYIHGSSRPDFRFPLFTLEQLNRFPPQDWWIDKYLLKKEITVFYGLPGTYKSFGALDWACFVAAQGFTVIYIAAEGYAAVQARIRAWLKHHSEVDLPTLLVMPTNVNLHSKGEAEAFIEQATEQLTVHQLDAPVLVVIDTKHRNFIGGDPASPKDVGLWVAGVEKIRAAFDCAVLIVEHTIKDGSQERGIGLRESVAAMFKFTRDFRFQSVRVECDRMKESVIPDAVTLTMRHYDLPAEEYLPEVAEGSLVADWPYDADALQQAGGVNALIDARVVTFLQDNPGTHTTNQIEREVVGKATAIRKSLQRLTHDGRALCIPDGQSHLYGWNGGSATP